MIELNSLKLNSANPRQISEANFIKLKKSIKDFPDMMAVRPIVCSSDGTILGGNMRYRALQALEYKSVPESWVKFFDNEKQAQEFIIKDNLSFGAWDWDSLANEWDAEQLEEWGLDIPVFKEYEEIVPSGYDETQKWFLNVEFENENECQKKYEELIELGFICKIVQ
jgi:hypothetical protein